MLYRTTTNNQETTRRIGHNLQGILSAHPFLIYWIWAFIINISDFVREVNKIKERKIDEFFSFIKNRI